MIKKVDLRIRKTKSSLYKSLLKLMQEMEFEEIKVTDICNIAMINRSTFYDHFNDKYELLASFIEDLKNELLENLNVDKNITSIKDYYLELLKLLSNHIEKNLNIYSSLSIIKKNNHSIAFDMMFDASLEAVNKKLNEEYINTSNIPNEVISLFYVSGVTKLCTEAIKEPDKFNSEELLKYLEELIPDVDYLKPKK